MFSGTSLLGIFSERACFFLLIKKRPRRGQMFMKKRIGYVYLTPAGTLPVYFYEIQRHTNLVIVQEVLILLL